MANNYVNEKMPHLGSSGQAEEMIALISFCMFISTLGPFNCPPSQLLQKPEWQAAALLQLI